MAAPGECDEGTDTDRWQQRERAEEQHGGNDTRFIASELRQCPNETELGDADATR